jgi:N-dimethylarginine dimethylaminohydrolase
MSRLLMSTVDHYGVRYVINDWMEGQQGNCNHALATTQWSYLKKKLAELTEVVLIQSDANCPDLVFTANAGTVRGDTVVLSHFKHKERQLEEPIFRAWFLDNGYKVLRMPDDVFFEGAGDSLFSATADTLWMGYGFRSDLSAGSYLEQFLGVEVLALKLIDSKFYHLDTCFCPLVSGYVMYYPAAFDAESNAKIESYYPSSQRIAVTELDAKLFACNAVSIAGSLNAEFNNTVVLNDCSASLERDLNAAGNHVVKAPMSEFLKSGGATKCLTLRLPA